MLFLLLLVGMNASSQSLLFPKDSAIVKEIDLPSKEPFDTARSYSRVHSSYVYIISDKDVYDLFGYDISMRFYNNKFDFTNYHVLGELICRQCLETCRHDEGYRVCHRNACNKEWVWVVRDNQKAFTEIPATAMPGHIGRDKHMFYDTVIIAKSDTARWYTTGHGDCFAHFKYAVVADKYHHALILKEWNYWGGCRAGGSKEYTITFKEPEAIVYKVKRTILMKRLEDY